MASWGSRQGGGVALKAGVVHGVNPVAPAREHFPVKPLEVMALPCHLSVPAASWQCVMPCTV